MSNHKCNNSGPAIKVSGQLLIGVLALSVNTHTYVRVHIHKTRTLQLYHQYKINWLNFVLLLLLLPAIAASPLPQLIDHQTHDDLKTKTARKKTRSV